MIRSFKFTKIKFISFMIIVFCCFGLTSCGAKYGQKTAYLEYASSKSGGGCSGGSTASNKADWMISYLENGVDSSVNEYIIAKDNVTFTDEEKAQIKLTGKLNGAECVYVDANGNEVSTVSYLSNLESLIDSFVTDNHKKAIANTDNEKKINEHFQVSLIENDIETFKTYITNIKEANVESINDVKTALNGTAGCFDTNSDKIAVDALNKIDEVKDVYLLGALFIIQVDNRLEEFEPIKFYASSVGDFFSHFFNNIFIFPVAWLLYIISKLCGGYYVIGLLLTTIIVRTLGWPIYAKTNDMSLKMSLMQPELQKIQEKYAGRNDPESQRMMQMEQAKLYRDNKIGIGGCLAPFFQFPIFMAVYRAISRLPYTKTIAGSNYTLNWANNLKSTIFGVDLFESRVGSAKNQLLGIIVLVVLVVGTQILSQVLTTRRQKKNQQKQQEDIPLYKRQAAAQQQNSTQSTMKFMLWFMIFMMGSFVWTSKAGLGFYWLIGNIYSMVQMFINNLTSEKRMEKLKNKRNGYIAVERNKNNVYSTKNDRKR